MFFFTEILLNSQSYQSSMEDNKDEVVEIELEEKDLLNLCLLAHEENITLNELINKLLREFITNESKDKV